MPVKISDNEFFYHTFEVHKYFTIHNLITSALKNSEEESDKNTIKENLVSLFRYRLSEDPGFQQYLLGKIQNDAGLFQRTVRYINYLKEYATFDKEYCIYGSRPDNNPIKNDDSADWYYARYIESLPAEDEVKHNKYSLFHKILDTNILEKLTLSLGEDVDESVNRLLHRIVYADGSPYFSCNLIPQIRKLKKKNTDVFNSTITGWRKYFHDNITYKQELYLPLFPESDSAETAYGKIESEYGKQDAAGANYYPTEDTDARKQIIISKELTPASAAVITHNCPLFYGICYAWDFRKKIAHEFSMDKKEETQPFWKVESDAFFTQESDKPSDEKPDAEHVRDRRRTYCQNLKDKNSLILKFNAFTTDFLSIAAELWFREMPESKQLEILNTEYPYSIEEFLKDNMPENICENTADELFTAGYYAEAGRIYQYLLNIEEKKNKRRHKKYHYSMLLGECARLTLDYKNALEYYADAKKNAYSAINSGRWDYSYKQLDKPEYFEFIADLRVREMTHTLGKSSFSIPTDKIEKFSDCSRLQLEALKAYVVNAPKRLGIYSSKPVLDAVQRIETLISGKEQTESGRDKQPDIPLFIRDADSNPASDLLPQIKRVNDAYQNRYAVTIAEAVYNSPKYLEKRCLWYDRTDKHTMYHQYKLSVISHLTYAKLLTETGDFQKAQAVLNQYEKMRISGAREFLLSKFKECREYENYRTLPHSENDIYTSLIKPVIDKDTDLNLTEYYIYEAVCRICLKQMTADGFKSLLEAVHQYNPKEDDRHVMADSARNKQGSTYDTIIRYLINVGKILIQASSKTGTDLLKSLESLVLEAYPGFDGEYFMTRFYVEYYWLENAAEWFDYVLKSDSQQTVSAENAAGLKLECADFYLKCGKSQKALEALRAVESAQESDISGRDFWRKYAKAYEQNRDYANVKKCYLKIQEIASQTNTADTVYDEEIEKINQFLERNISLSNKFIESHPEISEHFQKAEYASIPFYQQQSESERRNCVVPLIYYAWGYEAYLSASVWKYVRRYVQSCEIDAEQYNKLDSWWIKPFQDISNEKAQFAPTLGNWANLAKDLDCEIHENKVKEAMISYLKKNYDEETLKNIISVAKILFTYRNDICHAKPVYLTQNEFLRRHKKIVTRINQIIAFIDGINEKRESADVKPAA
ncbi:MAG TPA: hypothetical protein O0X42_01800 [Methanocorpusculum sp.]|nr:hypothetical protein [Methanocorpusculum sp.]